MRCDCCRDTMHPREAYADYGYRLCSDCYFSIECNEHTIEREILYRRKELAGEPEYIIRHNIKSFKKQFLPHYAVGVSRIAITEGDIRITVYCKLHHVPIRGKTSDVYIDRVNYNAWANNLGLYNFIHEK